MMKSKEDISLEEGGIIGKLIRYEVKVKRMVIFEWKNGNVDVKV